MPVGEVAEQGRERFEGVVVCSLLQVPGPDGQVKEEGK